MSENEKDKQVQLEVGSVDLIEKYNVNDSVILQQAREANEEEHELTARRALKEYYPAVFWSIVMSATIIMEGYDTSLMSSFYAYDSFKKKYGILLDNGEYSITGQWQSALGCASNAGTIIALLFNGILVERFGHRKVILGGLFLMTAFIFITVFAKNIQMLFVGNLLCGFPWGIFSVVGLIYASEVAPLPLRGFLSAFIMMCWATGQLIAAGVLKGLLNNKTEWSYRLPFAVQWVWVLPILIATILCPESPYWLVRKGEYEKAEKLIRRLGTKAVHHKAKAKLNMIIHTNEIEKQEQAKKGEELKGWRGYVACFKGTNRRRTEISCISMASQIFIGNSLVYMPSFFFSQVGLDSTTTYNLNLVIMGVAWIGTFTSWFVASRVGRRTIFLWGLPCMCAALLIIGVLQSFADNPNVAWGQVAMTFSWGVVFVLTLAPVAYTVMSEVSSTRLRSQTIALGRNFYNVVGLIVQIVQPYLINSTALNMKGRTAYVFFRHRFLYVNLDLFQIT